MNKLSTFSAALAVLASVGIAYAAMHSEGDDLPKGKPGDGYCMYKLQNLMMDGQVKTCQQPANEDGCKTLGSIDDNSDAVHGDGDCPSDGALAICDTGQIKYVYYEDNGQLGGLEIGCGFQGGEWIIP